MIKINKLENKKGVELTLNLIVILIIALIVLLVIIYFFSGNFLSGSEDIKNISESVLGEYTI
jgi:hypothetical protein